MSVAIELSDLLEIYPFSTADKFQQLLSAKREFKTLASDPYEKLSSGRGAYFKHQKFTHRFLRIYDDLLITDETGTGKSCSVLGFTEWVRDEIAKALVDPASADEKLAHFKKVIFLCKGSTQKNEFKNQLVCKCSQPGKYETDKVQNALTATSQKKAVNKEVKQFYEVKTYTTFAHEIDEEFPTSDPESDEKLILKFSDTIFWIDEAHNLLIENDQGKREKQKTYRAIWRVLHLAKRIKRIISTATPMINSQSDIGSLMNLILPADGFLPPNFDYKMASANDVTVLFPDFHGSLDAFHNSSPVEIAPFFRGQFTKNYDFAHADLKNLEPYFRGKIGFVRALETGAVVVEKGEADDNEYTTPNGVTYRTQFKAYTSIMSEFQTAGYLKAVESETKDENNRLYSAQRLASNFIFPDGNWGSGVDVDERENKAAIKRYDKLLKEGRLKADETRPGEYVKNSKSGFAKYVIKRGNNYYSTPEFKNYLANYSSLSMLSCKFAEIVRLSINDPGNVFIYSEYVEGSGAVVLALAFEAMGLERFSESSSIFENTNVSGVKPYCASASVGSKYRQIRYDFPAKPRYAFLDRHLAEDNLRFPIMMEAMNSYENRHGDYIKILISSRVGRDGINVNNVLQIHLVGPEWNQSAVYQAMSRGIRATSHVDLINEKIQYNNDHLLDNPDDVSIEVAVYKHAAVAIIDNQELSTDLYLYRLSEDKDRQIKRILRIMKQCAIGCQVHRARNIRSTDVDGSAVCDYQECNYVCADPNATTVDNTTYDILYADDEIDNIINGIINIYKQKNVCSLEDIVLELNPVRRKMVMFALEKIIDTRKPLIDRFGYTTFLREDNDSYFLDRSYPDNHRGLYAMSLYTQGLIGIETTLLSDVVVKYESSHFEKFYNEILETGDINKLSTLTIDTQAYILEKVILQFVMGDRSEFIDSVLNRYANFVYQIHDPVTELNTAQRDLMVLKPRKGRSKLDANKVKIQKITKGEVFETDTDSEIVYLHTLHTLSSEQTKYNLISKFKKAEGKLRLLKPSQITLGWRNLEPYEIPIYNKVIQFAIDAKISRFENLGIYGIGKGAEFRIKGKDEIGVGVDNKKAKKSRICITWERPELIDLLWDLEVPLLVDEKSDRTISQMRNILNEQKGFKGVSNWADDKVAYYHAVYFAKSMSRNKICEILEKFMNETGRVFEL